MGLHASLPTRAQRYAKAASLALALAFLAVAGAGGLVADARASEEISPDLIRRIELQWLPEEEVRGYELELATNPEFTSPLYSEKLKDTRFSVDLLPGSYYYHVRAIDQHGRPGRWTPIQELSINARPPILLWPDNHQLLQGNLPDTGIPLEWRTSGPGIRYLIEIKVADDQGNYNETVVRQEVDGTVFPFFPQAVGKYQWSVHTLGAGGDEPGVPWEFEVEGVVPRGVVVPPGMVARRVVRYVPPWWRGHWTIFTRYGQAESSYSIIDQELGATGNFSAIAGYVGQTLNWEWHDPVNWTRNGIPWFELEWELDRQTVLSESVVLPTYLLRVGAWYDEWLKGWRFSPLLEAGLQTIAVYQPRSATEAARSNSDRTRFAVGPAAEYQLRPFLVLGAQAKFVYETGGVGGLATKNGDQLDPNRRGGTLKSSTGYDLQATGTMLLGPRMKVQGRARMESQGGSWTPRFFAVRPDGTIAQGDTTFSFSTISFDVSFGFRF